MIWRPGTVVTVVLDGQELAAEITRLEGGHAILAVRIPHTGAGLFPDTGHVLWPDGREQVFSRSQASACTLVEIAVPLAEPLQEEVGAEVHVRRRLAVDVRSLDHRLVASGHTRTCSAAGAKLELNRPLQSGERYKLGLYLPEGILKLEAKALGADPEGRAIVTFHEVAPAQHAQLEAFVRAGLRGVARKRTSSTPS